MPKISLLVTGSRNKVSEALAKCQAMLVVVSTASLQSQWVPYEIGQATALGKTVIPYVTEPALNVPQFIQDLNYATSIDQIRKHFVEEPDLADGDDSIELFYKYGSRDEESCDMGSIKTTWSHSIRRSGPRTW